MNVTAKKVSVWNANMESVCHFATPCVWCYGTWNWSICSVGEPSPIYYGSRFTYVGLIWMEPLLSVVMTRNPMSDPKSNRQCYIHWRDTREQCNEWYISGRNKVKSPGDFDNEGGFNMDDNFFGIKIVRSWSYNGRCRKCPSWGLHSCIHTCRFHS